MFVTFSLIHKQMIFYIVLSFLFLFNHSTGVNTRNLLEGKNKCIFKRMSSPNNLLEMNLGENCHLKKKIRVAIERRLSKLPKVIVIFPNFSEPKIQSEEDTWESGEVIWKPDELGDPSGNVTGYVIFPLPRKPISPLDFAMSFV